MRDWGSGYGILQWCICCISISSFPELLNTNFGGSFGQFRSGRWRTAEMRHLPFLCLLLLWNYWHHCLVYSFKSGCLFDLVDL